MRHRSAILAAIGALAGLVVILLIDRDGDTPAWAAAGAAAAVVFAGTLALTLDAVRPGWSAMFAAGAAIVIGLIFAAPSTTAPYETDWRWLLVALALGIAVPFFQATRERGRFSTDYRALHGYAWTDAVVLAGGLAFAGALAVVLALWAGLFALIGIGLFSRVFGDPLFVGAAGGAALAGGVSLFRDWSATAAALQRVVRAVFGVLAPLLGFALVLFLLSLPATGVSALWEATRSTTPLLLSAVLLALLLANAVIGDDDGEAPAAAPLLWGARALGVAMLPLALLAAWSTGLRIAQHGLTPDRLWAAVFTGFAVAYGALYTLGLARGRRWPAAVRRGNVVLALGVGAVALLLATPAIDFRAVAAANQVARLEAGRVAPEDFDFAALGAMGKPGEAAAGRLRRNPGGPDRAAIRAAAIAFERDGLRFGTERTLRARAAEVARNRAALAGAKVYPAGARWSAGLMDAIARTYLGEGFAGGRTERALLLVEMTPNRPGAILLTRSCPAAKEELRPACWTSSQTFVRSARGWEVAQKDGSPLGGTGPRASDEQLFAALSRGRIEVRTETRRRIYVDGVPYE